MLQVGRDKRAKAKLNQVGVLLPPRLGPAMAGKGQHQPVRVQHFLLQLDTAPATLPPLPIPVLPTPATHAPPLALGQPTLHVEQLLTNARA